MTRARCIVTILAAGFLCVGVFAGTCGATRAPDGLLNAIGFDQRLGARLPLDVPFQDAAGVAVRLGELLRRKPALLVPNYYTCTNLCSSMRAAVAQAVGGSGLTPGVDFEVLLVSIDTREGAVEARSAQRADAAAHPAGGSAHWSYLTGSEASVSTLMRTIGFRYFLDSRNGQYSHAAGMVLVTPDGRIAQYLFGVQVLPQTLRLALVGASRGGIGTLADRLLLLCCDYDASTGRYNLTIRWVMTGLCVVTLLGLGWLFAVLRRGERRRHALLGHL